LAEASLDEEEEEILRELKRLRPERAPEGSRPKPGAEWRQLERLLVRSVLDTASATA